MDIQKRKVCCTACGYSWETKTKLQHVSCPDCRHTNKTAEALALAASKSGNVEEIPVEE